MQLKNEMLYWKKRAKAAEEIVRTFSPRLELTNEQKKLYTTWATIAAKKNKE